MAKTTTILVSASLGQRNKHWGVNNYCQSKFTTYLEEKTEISTRKWFAYNIKLLYNIYTNF